MDTNATASADNFNTIWDGPSVVSILNHRFSSVDPGLLYRRFSGDNDCQILPSSSNQGRPTKMENGRDETYEEMETSGEGRTIRNCKTIFGRDESDRNVNDRVSITNNTEEDGASCYLCTHCGKGYDSEKELEEHLVQVGRAASNDLERNETNERHQGDMEEESEEYMEESRLEIVNDEMEDGTVLNHRDTSHPASTGLMESDSPGIMDDAAGTRQHKPSHRGRGYSCKFCSKIFDSNSALNVHYTHTHRDKPQYECDLCGRVYGVKRELATHRRLHDGQPTHRCRQCGKEFGTKQLLRKHELWHTGERSHVCPQCGKAFFQKGHLTQHMMIHAGGRPHACHLCQKTFIFKFDLNRHMKIHAERVGNAEENAGAEIGSQHSTTAAASSPRPMVSKSISSETRVSSDMENPTALDSIVDQGSTNVTPLLIQTLFPSATATVAHSASLPINSVIQQLQQHNSGNQTEVLSGAGVSPFGLFHQPWPAHSSTSFLDTNTSNGHHDQQQRAALAAAFAQALCHAQQQASFLATFSSTSPPTMTQTIFDDQRHQQQQVQSDDPNEIVHDHECPRNSTGQEHDSTSGSSPATADDPESFQSINRPSPTPTPTCDSCHRYRQRLDSSNKRIHDLERDLSNRQADVDALNSKIQRVTDVASRLLESCSDFDKLWMLHSKQVYSQIQNILNALN